jgi:hypothetical protein
MNQLKVHKQHSIRVLHEQGLSNREIARKLEIDRGTVSRYLATPTPNAAILPIGSSGNPNSNTAISPIGSGDQEPVSNAAISPTAQQGVVVNVSPLVNRSSNG